MRLQLKRFEIWSVVKIVFIISLIIGFTISLLYAAFFTLMSSFMGAIGGEDITPMLPASGLLSVMIIIGGTIFIAFFYTIGAMLFTVVYNILSRLVGGIIIETDDLSQQTDAVSKTYILDKDRT